MCSLFVLNSHLLLFLLILLIDYFDHLLHFLAVRRDARSGKRTRMRGIDILAWSLSSLLRYQLSQGLLFKGTMSCRSRLRGVVHSISSLHVIQEGLVLAGC